MKYESKENALLSDSEPELTPVDEAPKQDSEPTLEKLQSEIQDLTRAIKRRDHLLADLRQTLIEVKQFKGILPICASCKKIRDYDGYWSQIESYMRVHADVEFSHGMCPDCMTQHYPDLGIKSPACDHQPNDNVPR